MRFVPAWLCLGLATGCGFLAGELPSERPPLHDLEEPTALLAEPDDEAARKSLATGTFTGIYVKDGAESLEALEGGESVGVLVTQVIENSPGHAAGIQVDDLLLEVWVDAATEPAPLGWASHWRKLELESAPGSGWRVVYEREGREREATLTVTPRVAAPLREAGVRLREEERVGVVLRTPTEVEARAAGLPPGAGAVVVGLSRGSPWRSDGVQFQDLITKVDGQVVGQPNVVLDAIRAAPEASVLTLELRRGSEVLSLPTRLSSRDSDLTKFSIPILFSHEKERTRSDTSLLLGLLGYEETPAAWEFTLLWLIKLRGGDADRLEEAKELP